MATPSGQGTMPRDSRSSRDRARAKTARRQQRQLQLEAEMQEALQNLTQRQEARRQAMQHPLADAVAAVDAAAPAVLNEALHDPSVNRRNFLAYAQRRLTQAMSPRVRAVLAAMFYIYISSYEPEPYTGPWNEWWLSWKDWFRSYQASRDPSNFGDMRNPFLSPYESDGVADAAFSNATEATGMVGNPEAEAYLSVADRIKLAELRRELAERAREYEEERAARARVAAVANEIRPGATDLVMEAVQDPSVNGRNFAEWARSKLPSVHKDVKELLVTALGLLFAAVFSGVAADMTDPQGPPGPRTTYPPLLGSFQNDLPLENASAKGCTNVVDRVFAAAGHH